MQAVYQTCHHPPPARPSTCHFRFHSDRVSILAFLDCLDSSSSVSIAGCLSTTCYIGQAPATLGPTLATYRLYATAASSLPATCHLPRSHIIRARIKGLEKGSLHPFCCQPFVLALVNLSNPRYLTHRLTERIQQIYSNSKPHNICQSLSFFSY